MAIIEILLTGDGSHTVFSSQFNAHYHSGKGAITESKVVFIQSGLEKIISLGSNTVKIFEMGFGTGLNVHLSHQYANQYKVKIDYTSIEAFPLKEDIWKNLNYITFLGDAGQFFDLHKQVWNQKKQVDPYFSFTKLHGTIEDYNEPETFDLIYFDAFAPGTQPELWEDPVIKKMYTLLRPGGLLVTYCAKGEFKRCLKRNLFTLESLPGPPGKREIIRATK